MNDRSDTSGQRCRPLPRIVLVAWLAAAAGALAEEPAPVGRPSPADRAAAWSDLGSPYAAVRREASRQLRLLPEGELPPLLDALLVSADATIRRSAADTIAVLFDRRHVSRLQNAAAGGAPGAAAASEPLAEIAAHALAVETHPSVVERLVLATSRNDACFALVRRLAAEGKLPAARLEQVVAARVTVLFEEVQHDGGIPGFFDGQFRRVFETGERAYGLVLRMAWDPRLHYVVRGLAIMALHEPRRGDLLRALAPLLIPVHEEIRIPRILLLARRLSDADERTGIVARLSQYARFSLAKAGIAAPIELKIRGLETAASADLDDLELRRSFLDEQEYLLLLDLTMNLVFDAGYHHQQLDDYAGAEEAYRRVLARPEPLPTKRWAYYNLACIRALQGQADDAIAELERAVAVGFDDLEWAARDGDLAILRGDPRFQRLLAGRAPGDDGQKRAK